MKGWVKIVILTLIILICFIVFYYITFSRFFEGPPPISKGSYLELNIYGDIPERSYSDSFSEVFVGEVPALDGLLNCIRKAKIDPNIRGIIIKPMGLATGWARIEELKAALRDYKTSQKPLYAYLEVAGNREYYLAIEADMIFGGPESILLITGLMGRNYYFKGLLDKIGVEADFVAYGKYKSAPEIFTRKDMSPAHREEINALLDDYYERYLADISVTRNIDVRKVEALIDYGIYSLEEASQKNLVDTLMFYNEFLDYLENIDGKFPRLVSYNRYRKISFEKLGVDVQGTVALIYCLGDIVSGLGGSGADEGLMIAEGMADIIKDAAEDKGVQAIVLRINSPGGSGIAADIIWNSVVKAREKKPVIVSMSDLAASGGYYIAMSADTIVAQPSSIVGSIGIYSGKFSMKELYRKLGVNKIEIPRGDNSNLFSELSTFNDKQRKIIENHITTYYQKFVQKAADGRGLTYEEVDKIGQGRVWTGVQSIQNGLVDKLGGMEDAIQVAKKMIGTPTESYVKIKIYPQQRSFFERLFSLSVQSQFSKALNILPASVREYIKGFFYFKDFEPLY
ncbi:MAG: signal peptide peptidase SppA, partial [bacterium]